MTTDYHEPTEELSSDARDVHRALATTIEELEAVDWYHQRADVTRDEELKKILIHHRDEEIEHAAMALEWLRRRLPVLDEELKTYLFTSTSIAGKEEEATGKQPASETSPNDASRSALFGLGIGKPSS